VPRSATKTLSAKTLPPPVSPSPLQPFPSILPLPPCAVAAASSLPHPLTPPTPRTVF
jgi:hypothetical protein